MQQVAGSVRSGLLVVSTERTPARPARLTQAPELHGRAAQLEGFSDQAHLGAVHVRGTQVKIVQQALDAPGDTPAGNPAHAACGEKGCEGAPRAAHSCTADTGPSDSLRRAVLCTAGCGAGPLVSTHQRPVASPES